MATDQAEIERKLFAAADQLWANAGLKPSEYARPVLGLLFLRYAETRFAAAEQELTPKPGSRLKLEPASFIAKGVIYLPPQARFSTLLALPEGESLGKALSAAMKAVEDANPELADVLPKNYQDIGDTTLRELIRLLHPVNITGDAFGRVYEYFMGEFAAKEMQKGGEFYTPGSLVDLIVDIIEPYHGRILDPACGSGGMFVHSADFVRRHQKQPGRELAVYGMEKTRETLRLGKMNLAVHGLSGTLMEGNSYYDDLFEDVRNDDGPGFDFVMANPPFNVSGIDKARLVHAATRYPFGTPSTDNGNYLWISLFYSKLAPKGRAGFVMANSTADARGSELEIRKKLIESGAVDVIVAISPNFFYTVTLPCTLWFFDRAKVNGPRADEVLFIDARHIFRQVDRAHRDFTPDQIEFLANIVRLWRDKAPEFARGSEAALTERFPGLTYRDIAGLCRKATRAEIAAQGFSLNPGRYIGVAVGEADDLDFMERLEALHEELEALNGEAAELQTRLAQNVAELLES